MPLLQINAGPEGLRLHKSDDAPETALRLALQRPGPVLIMVHGYKFAPGHHRACPHGDILSLDPRPGWKALSWPRELGFGTDAPNEGLAIGFGWSARGTLWQAYGRAPGAARQLAALIATLARLAPGRKVNLMTHSLGVRVVLGAVAALQAGRIGRVIVLNGADYAEGAHRAMAAPAGRTAELIHVTTRENDLFDFLFERLIRPPRRGARCLAEDFPRAANTLQIQLDQAATQSALARAGFDLPRAGRRVCHWSVYLRPGVMELYRTLLREPARLPLDRLRATLPDTADPRWSRLWQAQHSPVDMHPVDLASQALLSSQGNTNSTMNQ